jgi:hypothetical protein
LDGKAFDLGQLSGDQRDFYAQFLNYGESAAGVIARKYGRPTGHARVNATFLEKRTFNAQAWSHGDDQGIALHAGVPSLLHFCFNHILRNPHIFPSVGDAGGEQEHRRVFENGIPLGLTEDVPIVESISALPSLSRPHDEHRVQAAVALTELATTFCVFHEVGHIVGGHAAFHSRQMREVALTEFAVGSSGLCTRRLIRRIWEREADIIAAVMMMSFILNDQGTCTHYASVFRLNDNSVADVDTGDQSYHLLSALLFAIKVLFLYLAQVGETLKTRAYHPHPLIRATYVHSAIRLAAIHDLNLDQAKIDDNLDWMTDAADVAWEELGLKVPALQGRAKGDELARVVEGEITKLEEAHARLQNRYSHYSWMPQVVWREQS